MEPTSTLAPPQRRTSSAACSLISTPCRSASGSRSRRARRLLPMLQPSSSTEETPSVRARTFRKSSVLLAMRLAPRLRWMYSAPNSPAQRASCWVLDWGVDMRPTLAPPGPPRKGSALGTRGQEGATRPGRAPGQGLPPVRERRTRHLPPLVTQHAVCRPVRRPWEGVGGRRLDPGRVQAQQPEGLLGETAPGRLAGGRPVPHAARGVGRHQPHDGVGQVDRPGRLPLAGRPPPRPSPAHPPAAPWW